MARIRVRMYRQGLGDCFLLTFHPDSQPVHMLIDCGTLGATTTGVAMKTVVQDIHDETNGKIQLLVATHEHKDHVSGFRDQRALFDQIDVANVWVAWTEDPGDSLAQQFTQFQEDVLQAAMLTARALTSNLSSVPEEKESLAETGRLALDLLGFAGDMPAGPLPLAADFSETVHEAMSYASKKAGGMPRFLQPGEIIEPAWLPGVRFYVLGPPRSLSALTNPGDHNSPELYGIAAQISRAQSGCVRFRASGMAFPAYKAALDPAERQIFDSSLPFDPRFRLEWDDDAARKRVLGAYDNPANDWRSIEYDWMSGADDLALQHVNAINNTSVVLAVELIDDGAVIMLVGDAQLGNWLSWDSLTFSIPQADGSTREVRSEDLLKRTVLYKVGHHSSHNATINARGLELMERSDLIALIPVDRQVALKKKPPWLMPAEALYHRLLEKTSGRVIRSDTGWPAAADRPNTVPLADWNAALADAAISVQAAWIDVLID